ncbi:TonB family protein [Klebsiella oxytoca]|uniref:Protein TonB n=1 Tax=Klebsiella oxytoca TaxID=571 RepID=A0A6B8MRQ5_KLEOX|nr:TonB family protein [Klebsiella oxytoca]QGN39162.1 TonB family protein [Klebsiella oxytoca]
MKRFLASLILFIIPVVYAAESQPVEPRIKPVYPAKAAEKGIPGQVKAQFDVDDNGFVTNIQLLSSNPSRMFDNEVRAAMKKWRYAKGKPSRKNIITINFVPVASSVEVPAPNQPGSIQSRGVPFR